MDCILPLIFADGRPEFLDNLDEIQLRRFITYLSDFVKIPTELRGLPSSALPSVIRKQHMKEQIVKIYEKTSCLHLLRFSDTLAAYGSGELKYSVDQSRNTVCVHDTSLKILAKIPLCNVLYDTNLTTLDGFPVLGTYNLRFLQNNRPNTNTSTPANAIKKYTFDVCNMCNQISAMNNRKCHCALKKYIAAKNVKDLPTKLDQTTNNNIADSNPPIIIIDADNDILEISDSEDGDEIIEVAESENEEESTCGIGVISEVWSFDLDDYPLSESEQFSPEKKKEYVLSSNIPNESYSAKSSIAVEEIRRPILPPTKAKKESRSSKKNASRVVQKKRRQRNIFQIKPVEEHVTPYQPLLLKKTNENELHCYLGLVSNSPNSSPFVSKEDLKECHRSLTSGSSPYANKNDFQKFHRLPWDILPLLVERNLVDQSCLSGGLPGQNVSGVQHTEIGDSETQLDQKRTRNGCIQRLSKMPKTVKYARTYKFPTKTYRTVRPAPYPGKLRPRTAMLQCYVKLYRLPPSVFKFYNIEFDAERKE